MSNPTQTTKPTLFEIGEHFHALEELLIEQDGEITDEIDQWLQEYEGHEQHKIDAYCYLIQKYEEIAAEAKRLAERAQSYGNKAQNLKERLKLHLHKRHLSKMETPRFSITIAGNGGRQPISLLEGITPELLPVEYQRRTIEANKSRIRIALERGEPSISNYARFEERGTHLRIS